MFIVEYSYEYYLTGISIKRNELGALPVNHIHGKHTALLVKHTIVSYKIYVSILEKEQ